MRFERSDQESGSDTDDTERYVVTMVTMVTSPSYAKGAGRYCILRLDPLERSDLRDDKSTKSYQQQVCNYPNLKFVTNMERSVVTFAEI
jgi:hypothetical protein